MVVGEGGATQEAREARCTEGEMRVRFKVLFPRGENSCSCHLFYTRSATVPLTRGGALLLSRSENPSRTIRRRKQTDRTHGGKSEQTAEVRRRDAAGWNSGLKGEKSKKFPPQW